MVQAVRKPATARYIGFGEQGGKQLIKNTEQVNFFNFDNMRYKQVYNQGPLDAREPLYHSDPFFVEFNGHPETDCVYGIFVDNPAQWLRGYWLREFGQISNWHALWRPGLLFHRGSQWGERSPGFYVAGGSPSPKAALLARIPPGLLWL
ncbi:MAG TPA: hypothetical protein VIS96_02875 [Terrimicrobiaceae bacterium]